jgi:hypothetical protein
MRPEYEQAVDAVRGGWSYWLIFVVPAILIWFSVIRGRARLKFFIGAWILGGSLWIFHVERLQGTKERLMQTDAEIEDWNSDTGLALGKAYMLPYMLGYCGLHLVASIATVYAFRRITRRCN